MRSHFVAALLLVQMLGAAPQAAELTLESGGCLRTPAQPVLDGGYLTPAAGGTVTGGGFLTPTDDSTFAERIAAVRQGLADTLDDVQCAPARLERRLQRQLRGLDHTLAGVVDAGPAATLARLRRARTQLRTYCAAVAAGELRADCTAALRRPCPIIAPAA